MNQAQIQSVRCAFADLIGALQAYEQNDTHAHDWKAHAQSIRELHEAFHDDCNLEIPEAFI